MLQVNSAVVHRRYMCSEKTKEPVLWSSAPAVVPYGDQASMLSNLDAAIVSSPIDPRTLIAVVKSHQRLRSLMESPARIFEGHTIEEHTALVLRQFSRYVEPGYDPTYLSVSDFRLLLLLHDIGKPIPLNKKDQVADTKKVIAEVRDYLPVSDAALNIVNQLLSCDVLGPLAVKSQIKRSTIEDKKKGAQRVLNGESRVEVAKEIAAMAVYATPDKLCSLVDETAAAVKAHAQLAQIPVEAFFKLLQSYYRSDTLAYTIDAIDHRGMRGYPSLEYLFTWAEPIRLQQASDRLFAVDPISRQIAFSPGIEKIMAMVLERL